MNSTPVLASRRSVVLGTLGAAGAGLVSWSTAAPASAATLLRRGNRGSAVTRLQRSLGAAGYWCGSADGSFGHLTQQAVWALQKRHGLARDGVVGPKTRAALSGDTRLRPVGGSGNRVEIHLNRQLALVVRDGRTHLTLNTSTGNGEPYTYNGRTYTANTRPGTFAVYSTYSSGWQSGQLGRLYRPMYFNRGIALHGATTIPTYPASHGCARISTAAMDLVWSKAYLKMGSKVIVV